ncbi:L-histidine N(alpha)-methyltransferase [Stutzerimonas tarimensis]|uniref:L-histidine N(Alpha)-methyltransferase n=1 Tax=Stutzerimonas tarimensis TaxID=1507735 RepID=A0ABV7T7R2_9GAMM
MALAIHFHEQSQPAPESSLRDEALAGLSCSPKWLSPKFFYDRRGSELFEKICQQPEYYLTRTEEGILREAVDDIARLSGPGIDLIEFGSGASRKVRLLLEALRPISYLGIDISEDFLLSSTQRLAADYPWLEVHAACSDFSQRLDLPEDFHSAHPLAFYPGSSIGNFTPAQARRFLGELHDLLPPGGGALIGVDLVKDRTTLEAAYNDRARATAAFNLNVLQRIRDELDSDIDPSRFEHHAFFNDAECRIEMHLVATEAQDVRIEGQSFHFAEGESLHTENSYKYSLESFCALARSAGFDCIGRWLDDDELFSVHYLQR